MKLLSAPNGTQWYRASAHEWHLLLPGPVAGAIRLAVMFKVGLRWRVAICKPAPIWLACHAESAHIAACALEWLLRENAKGETVEDQTLPAVDSRWRSDHDGGLSRIAGGETIEVKPCDAQWQTWQCRLGGKPLGPRLRGSRAACDWLDAFLPPPAPNDLLEIPMQCERARLKAVRYGGDDLRRQRDVFIRAMTVPLRTLVRYGCDETAGGALVAAVYAGRRACISLSGYAAVFV